MLVDNIGERGPATKIPDPTNFLVKQPYGTLAKPSTRQPSTSIATAAAAGEEQQGDERNGDNKR